MVEHRGAGDRATGDDGGVSGELAGVAAFGTKRRLAPDRAVHCDDDAGAGALGPIRRRGTATGARRCRTDEQDRRDAGDLRLSEVIKQEVRQEGLREGELRGKVLAIGGFLGRDVPWSTIAAATGIDEATFRRLKHQFEAVDDGTTHPD